MIPETAIVAALIGPFLLGISLSADRGTRAFWIGGTVMIVSVLGAFAALVAQAEPVLLLLTTTFFAGASMLVGAGCRRCYETP